VRRPRQRHGVGVACGAPAYRVRTFSRRDSRNGGGGGGGERGGAAGRKERGGLAHRNGDGSRDDGRLVAGGRLEGRRRVDARGTGDEELVCLGVDDKDVGTVDGIAGVRVSMSGKGKGGGVCGGQTIGSRKSCRRRREP